MFNRARLSINRFADYIAIVIETNGAERLWRLPTLRAALRSCARTNSSGIGARWIVRRRWRRRTEITI